MKKYFVVYFYKVDRNAWGIGNAFLDLSESIETVAGMREVERTLKEKNRFLACSVINYCEIDGDYV